MTSVSITFQIDNIRRTVRLFGLTQPMLSAPLASNVSFVLWDDSKATGEIVYNDRPPIPEIFSDPSPYQTYINDWISGAASSLSLPLTLAQAQAIKSALVGDIFVVKSQAPITVATSLGNFSFDISTGDPASILNTTGLLSVTSAIEAEFGQINSSIATAFASVVSAVNSDVVAQTNSELSTAVANFNSLVGVVNANASQSNAALQAQEQQSQQQETSPFTNASQATFSGGVQSLSSVPALYSSPPSLPSLTAPVMMLPIGATSYPAFTLADLFTALAAAQRQITNELAVRASKLSAIAALQTIAAVVTFDATTGW